MYCPNCGKIIQDSDAVCPFCGTPASGRKHSGRSPNAIWKVVKACFLWLVFVIVTLILCSILKLDQNANMYRATAVVVPIALTDFIMHLKSGRSKIIKKCILYVVAFVFVFVLGVFSVTGDNEPASSDVVLDTTAISESTVNETVSPAVTSESSDATESTVIDSETADTEPVGREYVLNTNTKKFHYPSCASAKKTKDSNKQYFTGTRNEVISKGYTSCGVCHP